MKQAMGLFYPLQGSLPTTQRHPFSVTQKAIFVSYKYSISVGFSMQPHFFLSPSKPSSRGFYACLGFLIPPPGYPLMLRRRIFCCHELSHDKIPVNTFCSFSSNYFSSAQFDLSSILRSVFHNVCTSQWAPVLQGNSFCQVFLGSATDRSLVPPLSYPLLSLFSSYRLCPVIRCHCRHFVHFLCLLVTLIVEFQVPSPLFCHSM